MLLLVAGAALLLGFGKAGVAGTLGPIVTVLLALALPADDAIGLQLPMLIFADSFAVAAYWRKWDAGMLPPLIASALLGIAAGTFVVSSISESGLRRLIGVVMLIFAGFYAARRGVMMREEHRGRWAVIAGSTAGLSSTISHSGGPPILMYLMSSGLEPKRFVGTTVAFFAIVNLLKVPSYFFADLFDRELIVSTLPGWLMIPVGVVLGRMLVNRINRTWFERAMLLLLVAGSLVLLAG